LASGIQIKPTNASNRTFHVTAHGVGDTKVFRSPQDKREFLTRYRNYLSPQVYRNSARRKYAKLHDQVSLLSYCLVDNHFHEVVHQNTPNGMANLLARTQAAYVRYFNDTHGRKGPLFDARYAAQPINDADHAKFAIAYVHLNEPFAQLDYPYSSHAFYTGERSADWLDHEAGLAIFGGYDNYKQFLNRAGPSIIRRKIEARGLDPKRYPYRPLD
jgi:hypothetical protein